MLRKTINTNWAIILSFWQCEVNAQNRTFDHFTLETVHFLRGGGDWWDFGGVTEKKRP